MARAGIAAVQSAITRASAATIVHEAPFRRMLPGATVIPHGIESVDARATVPRPARALGLDDRFVVLCFGFLAPYKGVELVLEAARHLGRRRRRRRRRRRASAVARGRGGFGAELRARYGDVARFTGWVPDGDVARWFSAADVAVFPYPKPFSSSGVLALALAHGTPVAAVTGAGPLRRSAERAHRADATRPRSPPSSTALAADPDGLDELAALDRRARRRPVAGPPSPRRHADLYEEVLDVERAARRRVRAG